LFAFLLFFCFPLLAGGECFFLVGSVECHIYKPQHRLKQAYYVRIVPMYLESPCDRQAGEVLLMMMGVDGGRAGWGGSGGGWAGAPPQTQAVYSLAPGRAGTYKQSWMKLHTNQSLLKQCVIVERGPGRDEVCFDQSFDHNQHTKTNKRPLPLDKPYVVIVIMMQLNTAQHNIRSDQTHSDLTSSHPTGLFMRTQPKLRCTIW
jgi:hypothetical protein